LQRCVRAIEAASAGGASSSLDSIASSAALTHALFNIRNIAATNAVFAVLGCDWAAVKAAGIPLKVVKAAGCDPASATSAGYDLRSLIMEFGYDTIACVGCDMKSIILVSTPLLAPPALRNSQTSTHKQRHKQYSKSIISMTKPKREN
jgi:hypothetical protein